jgi:hypothetical protein
LGRFVPQSRTDGFVFEFRCNWVRLGIEMASFFNFPWLGSFLDFRFMASFLHFDRVASFLGSRSVKPRFRALQASHVSPINCAEIHVRPSPLAKAVALLRIDDERLRIPSNARCGGPAITRRRDIPFRASGSRSPIRLHVLLFRLNDLTHSRTLVECLSDASYRAGPAVAGRLVPIMT